MLQDKINILRRAQMDEKHRGKITKKPAAEVVKYLIGPAIAQDLERSYQTILDINKAHVIMLAEEGIIKTEVARAILDCTQKISAMQGHPEFEINPNVEDLYFNFERYLLEQTGAEIGGQQHTARSRNDLFACEQRMDIRRYYLKICGMFNELRQSMIDVARANTDVVLSGYTHMQPEFLMLLNGTLSACRTRGSRSTSVLWGAAPWGRRHS
jgi:argininosuccinate lyase